MSFFAYAQNNNCCNDNCLYRKSLNKFRSIYNEAGYFNGEKYVQSLIKFIKLSIICMLASEIFCFLATHSGKSHLAYNARLIKFRSIYNKLQTNSWQDEVQSLNKFIKLSISYMLASHFFCFLLIQSEKSVLAKTGSCPY